MAKDNGGAIVIDARTADGAAFLRDAQRLERAARSLDGALARLGDSLELAFRPVAATASPALAALADRLGEAALAAGSFVAALTGQEAFVKLLGAQRKYAAGAKRTASAAKGLRRQLARFDELDILKRSGSSGGGGGTAGSWEDAAALLEAVPIDEGILNFARRLREMFAAGDYEGAGGALAEGLNAALEKAAGLVRWENVRGTVEKYVDGFCGVFNGLAAGVDWRAAGDAFGAGVDTLVRAANRLLAGIRFDDAGRALGEGLTGAVAAIDFGALGETLARLAGAKLALAANALGSFDWSLFAGRLAAGFNAALGTLGEALDGLDWAGLARRLTQGLNRFIRKADWKAAGGFLGKRISDVLGALREAVSDFRWDSAGRALSDAVNGLVKNVDWTALGKWLDRTIKGLLDFGLSFLEGFDAKGFGDGLGRALEQVRWDEIAGKLWRLLNAALVKLGGVAQTLLGQQDAEVGVRLQKKGWTSVAEFVGTAVTVLTTLGRANWTSLAGFVGDRLTALVNLAKNGWADLPSFVGTGSALTALVGLAKQGWTTLGGFVGEYATIKTMLEKWGWTSASGFIGEFATIKTKLEKWGWSSGQGFVGEYATIRTMLEKWGWTSAASFVGEYATIRTMLEKWGWTSAGGFIGEYATIKTMLEKWGWTSAASFVGEYATVKTQLEKWGWTSISSFVGNSVTVSVVLEAARNTVSNFAASLKAAVNNAVGFSLFGGGGYVTPGGAARAFAGGGTVKDGGRAGWWRGARKYAGGTARAHGTVFVAGEAGPEVVGHVNGRTEILNQSQLAQAIYGAVTAGMGQAVNALGRYLAGHMTACVNAITATIGANAMPARLAGLSYHAPAVAAGAVPYEVSARLAQGAAELQTTLDANNEDLIRTIISVVGSQTATLVSALQALQRNGGGEGLSARQVIEAINRRTQMFGASPLTGV